MKENHSEEIKRLGGRLYYMDRPSFKPGDQRRLQTFFAEHKGEFTAVHCHPIWSSVVVAHEAKRSGIKHIIQHAHSTNYSEKKSSALRNRFLMKIIGLFATDYIACNNEAALLFGKRKAINGKVFILPNAIEIERYKFSQDLRNKTRCEFGANDAMILVGNVGRLSVEKNQCFILEVFKELHTIKSNSKLIIVGDGTYKNQIELKIKELDLQESVILTGKRKDIRAILSGLDFFIMPSFFEGTPVSAIEARSSGLPCLLSDSITKSVKMEGIEYLSINESKTKWAKKVLEMLDSWIDKDRNNYNEVVNSGFDIKIESYKLQNYYLAIL